MNIIILNNGEQPIYEQIYHQITSQIIRGDLEANYSLPSIRVVSRELGVSVITIKKAWELLERDGFIYTIPGKGCFVNDHHKKILENKKETLAETRIKKELPYYKNLGLTLEEYLKLVKENYNS